MSELSKGIALYQPYIKELKNKSFQILIFFAIGSVLGIVYYQKVLSFLMSFFELEGINLVLTSPYQFIDLSITTGFFIGIIFAFPISIFYILKFIKPALKAKEFKLLIWLLPISIILFIVGFIFGTWIVQYVINLFSTTTTGFDVNNIWDLSSFLSQIMVMGLTLALVFQLPILLTILLRLRVVTLKAVTKQRKFIYAGLILFAALLPPTDIVSLVLLSVIPLFLFEITLLLNSSIVSHS